MFILLDGNLTGLLTGCKRKQFPNTLGVAGVAPPLPKPIKIKGIFLKNSFSAAGREIRQRRLKVVR
jgi:hypothetical protein